MELPERREAFRVKPLPDSVRNLGLWFADCVEPDSFLDHTRLGPPRMQLGIQSRYRLELEDISAGGLSLALESELLAERPAEHLRNKRLLVLVELAALHTEDPLRLLTLSEVARVLPMPGGIRLGLRFLAQAKFIRHTRRVFLFDLHQRGIDPLAAWSSAHPCLMRIQEESPQDEELNMWLQGQD